MEIIIGIALGAFYVVSLIIAFMVGYGWDKSNTNDEEL